MSSSPWPPLTSRSSRAATSIASGSITPDSPANPTEIHFLGRNQFTNTDLEIQDAVHGAVSAAYAGSDKPATFMTR